MKFSIYFLVLGFCLVSCKRELSQEERDKLHQDSIHQEILAMGMNSDSSFSFKRYNEELDKRNTNDSLQLEREYIDFDYYQFIFFNDSVTYFYYYKSEYSWCGTPSFQAERRKEIYEEFKVNKKDLVLINSDTIIDFVKKFRVRKKYDERSKNTIILAINKDPIKNKSLNSLRKYLSKSNLRYTYRPLSTRERLVSDAKYNNTSEDFSKINWDSAYHVDFKKFYPEY